MSLYAPLLMPVCQCLTLAVLYTFPYEMFLQYAQMVFNYSHVQLAPFILLEESLQYMMAIYCNMFLSDIAGKVLICLTH